MTAATANKGTEIARKITIATVSGGPGDWFEKLIALPAESRVMNLMAVYGFANGYKPGATEFGEFVKILGNFRAVNKQTGETTDSPQLILPTYLGHSFAAALDAPERSGPIKFAFEIDVKYDVTAATKYVYVVRNVMPATQDDPLSALGALLSYEQPKALFAPESTPAPTPTPAPTSAPAPAAPKGKK